MAAARQAHPGANSPNDVAAAERTMTSHTAAYKRHMASVFDRAAATYDAIGVEFFGPAGRELVKQAGLQPGQRVLDIGCGRGASLIPAADRVGRQGAAVGIDLSRAMAAAARAALQTHSITHANVQVADAERPPFAEASFDAVLMGLALHFLPNPHAALSAGIALLTHGGRLALSTPGVAPDDSDIVDRIAEEALQPFFRTDPALRCGVAAAHWSQDVLTEELTRRGMIGVRSVDRSYPIALRGADHYWQWKLSHGARARLETIPANLIPTAQTALAQALSAVASPDGRLHLPMPVRFTTATRA